MNLLYWYIFGSYMLGNGLENFKDRKIGSPEVAAILRSEIVKGRWEFNDRLPPERELSATYGVARGTVREALNRLAKEKFVEVRPGSGAYVVFDAQDQSNPAIDSARPLELIDARFALEPHVCRLAVLHARVSDFQNADDLLGVMEASVDDKVRFSEADTAFHSLLAETTGNSLLIWMISQISSVRIQDQWSRVRNLTLSESVILKYNSQHRQILNAIRAREAERAATLMKEHLETARLSLTRSVDT